MEFLVLIVIIAVALGGFMWWQGGKGKKEERQAPEPKTIDNVEPGDAIRFWDGDIPLVDTVLDVVEQVGERTVNWRWIILSDGRLLEASPEGKLIYGGPEILHQGSAAFEQLTSEEGALKTFEQRVRDGMSGLNPVHFRHGRASYQMRSTGTFSASTRGNQPTWDAWRDISPKAGDNVYFKMESASGAEALGIWTSHIALHVGQRMKESDIGSIYSKGREESSK